MRRQKNQPARLEPSLITMTNMTTTKTKPSSADPVSKPAFEASLERATTRIDFDPVIAAAWLYYHHGLTQADIAKELNVSRTTVANMLVRAKDDGLVTISLRPDLLGRLNASADLRDQFNLREAYVVPTPEDADDAEVTRSLGKAGAMYLEHALQPGEILGTAWGATMLEVARALSQTKIANLSVAQSLGSLSTAESFNPIRVASLMGEKLGARVYHLYVPAVVDSVAAKEILLSDRGIKGALEMARVASRSMIGIGKVSHDATVIRAGFMDGMAIDTLKVRGAVGDLSGRYFDLNGQPVVTELDERIIGLSWSDLRQIKPLVAVAGGRDKVQAVLGALRTGCVDVLITDERTARTVLELERAESSPI